MKGKVINGEKQPVYVQHGLTFRKIPFDRGGDGRAVTRSTRRFSTEGYGEPRLIVAEGTERQSALREVHRKDDSSIPAVTMAKARLKVR